MIQMAQIFEGQVLDDVVNIAREMGYRVTKEPRRVPHRSPWTGGLSSLVRGGRHRPDLLIENGASFVVVEVKTRPVLLGGVVQSQQYANHFDSPVVLCVPDDSFNKTPDSVKNYARKQNIRLCSVSKVRSVLKEVLG